MNKDYETVVYNAYFHFENVPKWIRPTVRGMYWEARNICAKIFNDRIDEINQQFEQTGEPFAFGPYLEDMNPKYGDLISKTLKPEFDYALTHRGSLIRIRLEYGDMIGYIPALKGSKIWVDFKPRKREEAH